MEDFGALDGAECGRMERGCQPGPGGSKDEEWPKQFQVEWDLKPDWEHVKSKGTARPLAGMLFKGFVRLSSGASKQIIVWNPWDLVCPWEN